MTNTMLDDNVRSCLIVQPGSKLRDRFLEINPGKICQDLTRFEQVGIRAMKFETARTSFLSDVFAAVAVVVA